MAAEGKEPDPGKMISPGALSPGADEAKAWTEVFTLFQKSGRDDRAAAFAMSMGGLRKKADELEKQMAAMNHAKEKLLQTAREEGEYATQAVGAPVVSEESKEASRAWGRDLAQTMQKRVQEAVRRKGFDDEPWQEMVKAEEARTQAERTLEAEQRKLAKATGVGDPEPEAPAAAAAAAAKEAEAKRQQQEMEAKAAEQDNQREAKRMKYGPNVNSKQLPVRSGVPPCGLFMRTGLCKKGAYCIWDHPEPEVNNDGFPRRPGKTVCALYQRTRSCKFGAVCAYDHPENNRELFDQPGELPVAFQKASAQQHQAQLMLHLQLQQESLQLQDPAAMMNAWVRFRITFSPNA